MFQPVIFSPHVISIHALLAESDAWWRQTPRTRRYFNPRSPCGERLSPGPPASLLPNFNPRSPCGERQVPHLPRVWFAVISIHALLAESDVRQGGFVEIIPEFQSTLSLRRATRAMISTCSPDTDFNPRSPCGERPLPWPRSRHQRQFQSTLSLRRATHTNGPDARGPCQFQSTLSLRRATTTGTCF